MNDKFLLLVKKAINNDSKAFAGICESKGKLVIYLCKNLMQGQEDAEDAAQEVFIQMQKSINTLRAPEAFNVWLNSIVFNTCKNLRRGKMKKDNNLHFDDISESFIEDTLENIPHECLEDAEMRQHVLDVIDGLPENYKLSIQMFYYEDMSYAEVAEVLGTSTDSVTGYLRRAKTLLRLEMEEKMPRQAWAATPMIGIGVALKEILQGSIDSLVSTPLLENCLTSAGIALAGGAAIAATGISKIVATVALLIGGVASVGYVANIIIDKTFSPQSIAQTSVVQASSLQEDETIYLGGSSSIAQDHYVFALAGRVAMQNPGTPDPYTNEGIVGLKLELVRNETTNEVVESTKTLGDRSNGYYTFTDIEPGEYRLRVYIPQGCTAVAANNVSVIMEDAARGTGWVALNGKTVFSLQDPEVSAIQDINILLKGGTIVSGDAVLQNVALDALPLVRVTMKDPQSRTVAVVTTDEKGHYAFVSPMVSQRGTYTIEYELEKQTGFKLLNTQHTVVLAPGESAALPQCIILDANPPSVSIRLLGGDCDCGHENPISAEIIAVDTGKVNVTWQIAEYGTGVAITSGTDNTALNTAMAALANGDYYINATATDEAGNAASAQIFISILIVDP